MWEAIKRTRPPRSSSSSTAAVQCATEVQCCVCLSLPGRKQTASCLCGTSCCLKTGQKSVSSKSACLPVCAVYRASIAWPKEGPWTGEFSPWAALWTLPIWCNRVKLKWQSEDQNLQGFSFHSFFKKHANKQTLGSQRLLKECREEIGNTISFCAPPLCKKDHPHFSTRWGLACSSLSHLSCGIDPPPPAL